MSGVASIEFARLHAALLPADCRRLSLRAQLFRFERLLPIPVDRLHVARTVLADGQVLVVGIAPERLREHLATRTDVGPMVWRLVPDAPPAHLASAGVDDAVCARLNLLHGPFEAAPRRRRRLAIAAVVHVSWLLVAALLLIGGEVRGRAISRRAAEVRSATAAAVAQVVPAHAGIPAEAALTMELRSLEQAARDTGPADADVATALTALWKVWPRDLRLQVDDVVASAGRIVVRGRAPALADVETLATAAPELDAAGTHFRIEPMQAQQADNGATFLLTWARHEAVR